MGGRGREGGRREEEKEKEEVGSERKAEPSPRGEEKQNPNKQVMLRNTSPL